MLAQKNLLFFDIYLEISKVVITFALSIQNSSKEHKNWLIKKSGEYRLKERLTTYS